MTDCYLVFNCNWYGTMTSTGPYACPSMTVVWNKDFRSFGSVQWSRQQCPWLLLAENKLYWEKKMLWLSSDECKSSIQSGFCCLPGVLAILQQKFLQANFLVDVLPKHLQWINLVLNPSAIKLLGSHHLMSLQRDISLQKPFGVRSMPLWLPTMIYCRCWEVLPVLQQCSILHLRMSPLLKVSLLHGSKSCREFRKLKPSKLWPRKTMPVPYFLHLRLACSCAPNLTRYKQWLEDTLCIAIPPATWFRSRCHFALEHGGWFLWSFVSLLYEWLNFVVIGVQASSPCSLGSHHDFWLGSL